MQATSTPAAPVVQVVAAAAGALVAVAQSVKVSPAGLPATASRREQVAEVAARVVPAVPVSVLLLELRVRAAPAMRQVVGVELALVGPRARPARRTRETEAVAVTVIRAA
jgi:hypothetical protein